MDSDSIEIAYSMKHTHSVWLSGGLKTTLIFRTLNAIYVAVRVHRVRCISYMIWVRYTLTKFVYLILPLKLLFICFSGWHLFTLAGFHEFSSWKDFINFHQMNQREEVYCSLKYTFPSLCSLVLIHHTNSVACIK